MSLVSVLEAIETDVLNIVHSAEAKAETWFKSFKPVLEQDVHDAWVQFKPVIIGLITAVEQVALTALVGGTPFNKLTAVVEGLIAAAASQGIVIARGTATTVVQQAVTSIGNAAQTAVK